MSFDWQFTLEPTVYPVICNEIQSAVVWNFPIWASFSSFSRLLHIFIQSEWNRFLLQGIEWRWRGGVKEVYSSSYDNTRRPYRWVIYHFHWNSGPPKICLIEIRTSSDSPNFFGETANAEWSDSSKIARAFFESECKLLGPQRCPQRWQQKKLREPFISLELSLYDHNYNHNDDDVRLELICTSSHSPKLVKWNSMNRHRYLVSWNFSETGMYSTDVYNVLPYIGTKVGGSNRLICFCSKWIQLLDPQLALPFIYEH